MGIASAVLTLSGTAHRTFKLQPGANLVFGRSLDVALPLEDQFVSREHCRITLCDTGVRLVDLDSANGTYVNGRRIREAVLRSGDQIELGNVALAVQVDVDAEPEGAPRLVFPELDVELRLQELGYRLRRTMSRSGMVSLHEARKAATGRAVALKVLPLAGPVSRRQIERFLQGARAHAVLRHPGIVRVYDLRQTEELLLWAMDFLEGQTLMQRITRLGRLPTREALYLTYQVAQALDYMHGKSVVHRDIKPQNVMVTGDHPVLIDFGLARKLTGEEGAGDPPRETLGTAGYMAPEQSKTAGCADQRADIYGLGATLHHCLCGNAPTPVPPEGPPVPRLEHVSPPVADLVERMLQPAPDARFQTPAELLEGCLEAASRLTGQRADASNIETILRGSADPTRIEVPVGSQHRPTAKFSRPTVSFRRRAEPSVKEEITDLELTRFLQRVESDKQTGALCVTTTGLRGTLHLLRGRVVRAEAGTARSRAALERILEVQGGSFSFTPCLPYQLGDSECDLRISKVIVEHLNGWWDEVDDA